MLVITLKKHKKEPAILKLPNGETIELYNVPKNSSGQVILGIKAPKDVAIYGPQVVEKKGMKFGEEEKWPKAIDQV